MKINRKKMKNRPQITAKAPVTVKVTGNIIEIRYMSRKPQPTIQKLDKNHYLDLLTGEVKDAVHHTTRAADPASVSQSLRNLRDAINTNLVNPENVLWVTLTYRKNMKDAQQLYEDYRRFWQRFKYYLKNNGCSKVEYIIAAEPQGRGAWHLHALFLFPEKAPFIPNKKMAEIWTHGFTKTNSLKEIDNPGLYLTAYLGDMEITEAIAAGRIREGKLAETTSGSKAVLKGARLGLYPAGMNIYRCSRGVKKPLVYEMTEEEAQAIVKDIPLIHERTISIEDDSGTVKNIINYRQYNTVHRKLCKESPAESDAGTDFISLCNQMLPQRHTAEKEK